MATGVRAITRGRMKQWATNLTNRHHTPILVMGIGHDRVAGQISVITVEDISDEDMIAMLSHALATVRERSDHSDHDHDEGNDHAPI